jgi:hypothetical protein
LEQKFGPKQWALLALLTLGTLLVYPAAGWFWDRVVAPHIWLALTLTAILLIVGAVGVFRLLRRK